MEKLVTTIRILYLLSQYKFEAVTAHSLESEGQLPNHCGSPLKSLGKKKTPHHSEVPSLLANSQCDWNLEQQRRGSEQSLDKVYFEVYASVLLA